MPFGCDLGHMTGVKYTPIPVKKHGTLIGLDRTKTRCHMKKQGGASVEKGI